MHICSIRKGLVCRIVNNCYWKSEVLILNPDTHLERQGELWKTCRERCGELSDKEPPTRKECSKLCNAAWRDRNARVCPSVYAYLCFPPR